MRTSRTARSKASVPAATLALYSPRLWPATTSGVSPERAKQRDRHGEQRRLRVGREPQLASGPLEAQLGERLAERRVGRLEHRTRAQARTRRRALPMPTVCDPWPGNTNAIFPMRFLGGPAYSVTTARQHAGAATKDSIPDALAVGSSGGGRAHRVSETGGSSARWRRAQGALCEADRASTERTKGRTAPGS